MLLTSLLIIGGVGGIVRTRKRSKTKKIQLRGQSPIKIREKQLQQVSSKKILASPAEKAMQRRLIVSSVNLVIGGTSLIYTPLLALTIPGLIYTYLPLYKLTYQRTIKNREISSYSIDAVLIPGIFIGGYFYVGLIASWIFTLGRFLLVMSESESKQNLSNLFGEQPRTAWVLVNDVELEVPFDQIKEGDIIIVKAGQTIPVDGVIVDGVALIDQHKLTGESQPVEKGQNEPVLSTTLVLSGKVCVRTEKAGTETVAMQIGKTLQNTADFKDSIQSRGEAIADKYTVPTLCLSAVFLPVLGAGSALAVLNNAFGYKMRVLGPASMLSFLNVASKQGVLIKDGRILDLLRSVDTIVFDKTGTLTLEQPTVGRIYVYGDFGEDKLLSYAAASESGQSHPIAKAILAAANDRDLVLPPVTHVEYEIGHGLQVMIDGRCLCVGSERFIQSEGIRLPNELDAVKAACYEEGSSVIMLALDKQFIGVIELRPTIRPEAYLVIQQLKERNISLNIMSGDSEQPTKNLAKKLGIDHYFANALPEDKADFIDHLQQQGHSVCFIGDGINDSIALKKANVSISLRDATAIATDAAQVILMSEGLQSLDYLFSLSSRFEKNMKKNLYISTVPSGISIAGILFFHWGIVAGITISASSLFIGIGNTIFPLVKNRISKKPLELENLDHN
ncbi:MAG: Lead, cadmium, zinc and mercury transporting ATPase (EC (EC; Copper-translocating P-type ATPase (EC [uncultured Thiotrichaceae bacterium]|uniref:Lead, cadmium, zinc and mercury transporting ATPase )) n=1 Tax=uncultured Thiotrichaceae bacterium TaxID=298394 RepID=A0A6S6TW36_9GAMM|nr:MAG: Lead, cadmium, zinc and mercury transporting ATPase (EC (EC; Copper-translocating P-type ATPase (EC [uncultured Thiotrichaceae bacterium]